MEFITNITIKIDEAGFKNHGMLRNILEHHYCKREGSCYKVKGTFKELVKLSDKLSAMEHHSSPAAHGPCKTMARQQDKHASTHVRSVDVSEVVWAYIDKSYGKELDKIVGNNFRIDVRRAHSKPSSTLQVSFTPHHASINPVRADFTRQRFITFYQRVASDLQVTSIPVSPHDHRDLERKFPQLLFKPGHSKCEVTGPFAHVAKLNEFLSQKVPSSIKSPVNKAPADAPSSRTSRPSPAHSKDAEEESCPICMDTIKAAEKKTLRCKHSFCRDCLNQAFAYKPVCPTCGELYGTLTGTQPEGGKMDVARTSSPLPGYEKYGTIVIHYYIPSGTQKEEHPNPGQHYEGVSRTAYLPDSSEGKKVQKLLERAFKQRLIFTVGRSTTSGRNNAVTWNDIHHKTSTHGGPTHYGYPDPDYLSRVLDELKVKGIE